MSTTTTERPVTNIVTGEVRLSYAHLWVPTAMEKGQKEKYSAAILIKKTDKKTMAKVNAAIEAAEALGKEKYGKKWIPSKLKPCLKDGDVDRPEDENYAGCYYLSAKSSQQPTMIDRAGNKIVDQDAMYSGVYAFVSLNFYPYDNVSIGVGVGLNNIMKSRDGEPFSGRTTAEEDFAELIGTEADDDDL